MENDLYLPKRGLLVVYRVLDKGFGFGHFSNAVNIKIPGLNNRNASVEIGGDHKVTFWPERMIPRPDTPIFIPAHYNPKEGEIYNLNSEQMRKKADKAYPALAFFDQSDNVTEDIMSRMLTLYGIHTEIKHTPESAVRRNLMSQPDRAYAFQDRVLRNLALI